MTNRGKLLSPVLGTWWTHGKVPLSVPRLYAQTGPENELWLLLGVGRDSDLPLLEFLGTSTLTLANLESFLALYSPFR